MLRTSCPQKGSMRGSSGFSSVAVGLCSGEGEGKMEGAEPSSSVGEMTTHLLLLSARLTDEQGRPLSDANCRGVAGLEGRGGEGWRRGEAQAQAQDCSQHWVPDCLC